jgi:hypothetical protein
MTFIRTSSTYLTPAWVLFGVGVVALIVVLFLGADPGIRPRTTLAEYAELLFLIVFEMFFVIGIGFLMVWVFASVGVFALARRAIADSGWGVVKTYVAGPGAPPWRGRITGDCVVRVPIPREVTTLSFAIDEEVLYKLVTVAEQSAYRQLEDLLGTP